MRKRPSGPGKAYLITNETAPLSNPRMPIAVWLALESRGPGLKGLLKPAVCCLEKPLCLYFPWWVCVAWFEIGLTPARQHFVGHTGEDRPRCGPTFRVSDQSLFPSHVRVPTLFSSPLCSLSLSLDLFYFFRQTGASFFFFDGLSSRSGPPALSDKSSSWSQLFTAKPGTHGVLRMKLKLCVCTQSSWEVDGYIHHANARWKTECEGLQFPLLSFSRSACVRAHSRCCFFPHTSCCQSLASGLHLSHRLPVMIFCSLQYFPMPLVCASWKYAT